ncbi:hypothetical protein [Halostella litorea]|uniref:hypothetical protein n=1 Tax=Halostella litorea TaxID=2528831 RepID=UPI001092229B|nr:hypothetical protein [Halostella litorea]
MFTVSSAKRLFAVTAVIFPFDVYLYGRGIGWGLHSAFGRYVVTDLGGQFLLPNELLALRSGFDPASRAALYAWVVAAALALAATLFVLATWVVDSPLPERRSDRLVGGAFVVAGGLFILSRALLYDFLLVGSQSDVNWFSVPLGAAYMLFVGVVFYRDLFQLGMEPADAASANDG